VLTQEWRQWLRLNRARGCCPETLFEQAVASGLDPADVARVLMDPPLTDPLQQPRAWRLDTDLAQIYEIPELLSREDCAALIQAIDRGLVQSRVTQGLEEWRTSRTCHLSTIDPALTQRIETQLRLLIGTRETSVDPLQGQRYDPGDYFRAHTDWFAPDTEEYVQHARAGGQRTWTVMVYLNQVEEGGQTVFPLIGRSFTPVAGMGLAWNNLHADGQPNHATLHEALAVQRGCKYVITKWFREEGLTS
jgi:prolyl 4-hydroxylase